MVGGGGESDVHKYFVTIKFLYTLGLSGSNKEMAALYSDLVKL